MTLRTTLGPIFQLGKLRVRELKLLLLVERWDMKHAEVAIGLHID